ncbi:MAG: efflux RND transporter periplasmic adaptor subunit [Caulobacteraceae bacterium]
MKTPPAVVALVLILTAGALAACGQKAGPPDQAATGPLAVEVAPVKSQLLSAKVALPAQLLPYESVDLYPKVGGFIEEIRVDRGSQVKKGELLVRLSAPEVLAQQQQAATGQAAAEAKLASDRATYDRLANAAKTPGAVALNDLNVAKQVTASDAAQADSAAKAAQAARAMSGYLEIRAPFDGVITTRNLHPGALVGPATSGGAPIVQLVTNHRLRLVVSVPEDSVQAAKLGQDLAFTVPSAPGQAFHGKVARMANAVDNRTRTVAVEADLDNADGKLTPGAFATVQWPIQRAQPSLRVPPTAVANDQERNFVIKVEGGKAHWVDVKTGMTADGTIEVFGALQPGDQVVRRGTDAIKDGAAVQPAPAK